jgi:hypothetical protein
MNTKQRLTGIHCRSETFTVLSIVISRKSKTPDLQRATRSAEVATICDGKRNSSFEMYDSEVRDYALVVGLRRHRKTDMSRLWVVVDPESEGTLLKEASVFFFGRHCLLSTYAVFGMRFPPAFSVSKQAL